MRHAALIQEMKLTAEWRAIRDERDRLRAALEAIEAASAAPVDHDAESTTVLRNVAAMARSALTT